MECKSALATGGKAQLVGHRLKYDSDEAEHDICFIAVMAQKPGYPSLGTTNLPN